MSFIRCPITRAATIKNSRSFRHHNKKKIVQFVQFSPKKRGQQRWKIALWSGVGRSLLITIFCCNETFGFVVPLCIGSIAAVCSIIARKCGAISEIDRRGGTHQSIWPPNKAFTHKYIVVLSFIIFIRGGCVCSSSSTAGTQMLCWSGDKLQVKSAVAARVHANDTNQHPISISMKHIILFFSFYIINLRDGHQQCINRQWQTTTTTKCWIKKYRSAWIGRERDKII